VRTEAEQRANSIARGAARIARDEADAATPELAKRLNVMREQLADAKRRGQRDRARMYADKVGGESF
jgi:hypothetical protein